jgi:hypothetical protein
MEKVVHFKGFFHHAKFGNYFGALEVPLSYFSILDQLDIWKFI